MVFYLDGQDLTADHFQTSTSQVLPSSADANAVGLTRAEVRAAERAYNTAVLAQAAEASMPDTLDEPQPPEASTQVDRKRSSVISSRSSVMKRLKLIEKGDV